MLSNSYSMNVSSPSTTALLLDTKEKTAKILQFSISGLLAILHFLERSSRVICFPNTIMFMTNTVTGW